MSLPLVDLSEFAAGSDGQRNLFAKRLVDVLKQYGYVKIRNHGLTPDTVDALFNWNRKFFELPVDTKRKVAYKGGSAPSRGYVGLGHEKTSIVAPNSAGLKNAKDVRESLDFGPPSDNDHPNLWPDDADLPGFRQCVESYYATCRTVSLHIMQALEIGLGVPSGCFAERTNHDSSEARLNYYPQVDVQELKTGNARRIWPHTDSGLITLLLQDDVGGLEFEDRQNPGAFLPLSSTASTDMVVNVADTLERWTNGVLRAGLHQVNTSDETRDREVGHVAARKSIVFFFRANGAASAGPIPCFVTPQRPAGYSEITAFEYLRQLNGKLYSY